MSQFLPSSVINSLKFLRDCMPIRLRHNKVFWRTYTFLRESQWWKEERLKQYQLDELRKLLNHAYSNVKYYRRIFDERGLTPRDIHCLEDLNKLPILTKEIVRNNFDDLIASNFRKRDFYLLKTSGSTLRPLAFYCGKNSTLERENAFIWTVWNIAGYRFDERIVDFDWQGKTNKQWRVDHANRAITIFALTLDEDSMFNFVKVIKKFKPKVLRSVPSMLVVFADFLRRNRILLNDSIKIVLCRSEMLYAWQRALMVEAFRCRIFSWYGQTEEVVLATECEDCSNYHIFPEYGVTEIVGIEASLNASQEIPGRIIGTGFNNYVMPFIRYDTGDIGSICAERCKCGRNYQVFKNIEGRENEYLVAEGGKIVPMIFVPYSAILSNASQFQFFQDREGMVTLKIVKSPNFIPDDVKMIRERLRSNLPGITVDLKFVSEINRNERGKLRYVDQKLKIKWSENF
jgi:phenylacetate-CoA ligase